MNFTTIDMNRFTHKIYNEKYSHNTGGMKSCDMFTLYHTLGYIKPKIVIESGVFGGYSTKLIRDTLGPEVTIYCIDPSDVQSSGYVDTNPNTIYFTGSHFIDFKDFDISSCDDTFAFFDDHQNAVTRLLQCNKKGIKHVLFNDNYPVGCGSHFTLEHLFGGDTRHGSGDDLQKVKDTIEDYHVFPNIYPGDILTGEGFFQCKSYFEEENDVYPMFKNDRNSYRWNTYVKLK